MSRLNRFRALPWTERGLLLEAALLLMLARLSVRAVPFRHVHRFLQGRWREHGPHGDSLGDRVELIDRALSRADGLFPSASLCLPRSLAAYVMLRRRGIPAVLYLGVRSFPTPAALAAHAWIDIGNERNLKSVPAIDGYTTVWAIGQYPASHGSGRG